MCLRLSSRVQLFDQPFDRRPQGCYQPLANFGLHGLFHFSLLSTRHHVRADRTRRGRGCGMLAAGGRLDTASGGTASSCFCGSRDLLRPLCPLGLLRRGLSSRQPRTRTRHRRCLWTHGPERRGGTRRVHPMALRCWRCRPVLSHRHRVGLVGTNRRSSFGRRECV